MKFNKSFTVQLSPEQAEKLLKALFGESEKRNRTKTFSHPVLVRVKSGDGIGFDTDGYVAVTNAKNNVGMLLKANYDKPFPMHEKLQVNDTPVLSKNDLVPGHTYLIADGDDYAFVKYLGHSMVLVRAYRTVAVTEIVTDDIPPHYEISIPVSQ